MRPVFAVAAALTALLLVPHVAADAVSTHVAVEGDVAHDSEAFAGLSLQGGDGVGLTGLVVEAQGGYGRVWEQAGLSSGASPTCGVVDETCISVVQRVPTLEEAQRFPEQGYWSGASLALEATIDGHRLNVIPLSDASLSVQATKLELEQVEEACLNEKGIQTVGDASCPGYQEDFEFMSAVPLPSPAQVVDGAERIQVVLRGDFALEFTNLALDGPDGVMDASTTEDDGPGVQNARFGRVVVQDAVVRIGIQEASWAAWAVGDAASHVVGEVLLEDMEGELGLNEVQRLDGSVHAAGSMLLRSSPSDDGLRLSGEERALDGGQLTTATDATPALWAWWLAIVVALLPAILIYMLAGRRGNATMDRVEAALQAGRYDRAARLADRILSFEPYDESAHLGRAIALTKAGRLADAAMSLQDYLSHNEPEDGSLHYVLGTALKELGEHERAHDALAEAAKRTPELAQPIGDDRAAYA